jgi:hypothetical protein
MVENPRLQVKTLVLESFQGRARRTGSQLCCHILAGLSYLLLPHLEGIVLWAIQKEIRPGIFAVMDGTFCGNGPGPRTIIPVENGLVLASADCVAIDAVAASIMGFDPMKIGYINMAHEAGLGVGRGEEMSHLVALCGKAYYGDDQAKYGMGQVFFRVPGRAVACWG